MKKLAIALIPSFLATAAIAQEVPSEPQGAPVVPQYQCVINDGSYRMGYSFSFNTHSAQQCLDNLERVAVYRTANTDYAHVRGSGYLIENGSITKLMRCEDTSERSDWNGALKGELSWRCYFQDMRFD